MIRVGRLLNSLVLIPRSPQLGKRLADRQRSHCPVIDRLKPYMKIPRLAHGLLVGDGDFSKQADKNGLLSRDETTGLSLSATEQLALDHPHFLPSKTLLRIRKRIASTPPTTYS
jgi:hypothetical protein